MPASDADLKKRLAAALADDLPPAGDHLDLATLTAYRGGELDEAAQRRVQDHLESCRACLDDLLELDAFLRPADETPAPGTRDLETAAAWRALRRELAPGAGTPAPPRSAESRPPWATLAAAALLLVSLGAVALWGAGEHRAAQTLRQRLAVLSQPQTDAAIVDLFPAGATRSEADGGAAAAELPAAAGHLTLVVNLPPAPGGEAVPATSYGAEIVDTAGRTVWSGSGLARSRFDTLRLGLPQGFLPPGDYRLRVLAADGDGERTVATYALRVVPP
jgi:anti-sigma factor RsiW